VFEIGAGGTAQLVGPSPSSTTSTPFSLTAQIIFHKLTIIPSITPNFSSLTPINPSILSIPEQHKINTHCVWAGGTCANYPDFFENHQFHVIYCVTLAFVLFSKVLFSSPGTLSTLLKILSIRVYYLSLVVPIIHLLVTLLLKKSSR
jgi:hypothetical protein